jgi:hypothetical protein
MTLEGGMNGERRWRAPLRQPRRQQPQPDEAARVLADVARMLLDRAPTIVTDVRSGSHCPVRSQSYDEGAGEDRAWRFLFEGVAMTCVLDERSERELLALVVGGASRGRLTGIERRISGEVIVRLLGACVDRRSIVEEPRARPTGSTWHCEVGFSHHTSGTIAIALYTACIPAQPARIVHPQLSMVTITLRAALPLASCHLASIAVLRPGELLRLARHAEVPAAVLFGGNRRVARGRLGSWLGERAILLTDIAPN